MELTWEDRIIKARIQMKSRYPFFWYIAMHLEPVEVEQASFPWATDGRHLLYCPGMLDKGGWDEHPEFIMLGMAHEAGHCAFWHTDKRRQGERDPVLWGIAIDTEMNYLLTEAGFHFPPKMPGVQGLPGPAEEHYDRLLRETEQAIQNELAKVWDEIKQPSGTGKGKSASNEDDDQEKDKQDDDQDGNQDTEGQASEGQQQGASRQAGEQDSRQDSEQDGQRQQVPRILVNPSSQSEEPAGIDWLKIISEAEVFAELEAEAQGHGNMPGSMEEAIERAKQSRADWRQVITSFFSRLQRTRFTYEKPNRRFVHRGIYLPGPKKEQSLVVLVLDSSGSMDAGKISQCLAEMWAVGQRFPRLQLLILVIDYDLQYVCKHPSEIKVRGRGGTSFVPAFEYVEEHHLQPAGMIYFTDLAGDFPDRAPRYPVVWAAVTDHKPPFGRVVRIPIDRRVKEKR